MKREELLKFIHTYEAVMKEFEDGFFYSLSRNTISPALSIGTNAYTIRHHFSGFIGAAHFLSRQWDNPLDPDYKGDYRLDARFDDLPDTYFLLVCREQNPFNGRILWKRNCQEWTRKPSR